MWLDEFNGMKYSNCSYGFGFEESLQEVLLGEESLVLLRKFLMESDTLIHRYLSMGVLHWLTFSNDEPLIVSFNLFREDFGFIPLPRENLLQRRCYLTIGLFEGHLSVVDHSFSIDIWVMKKYNDNESWVRQFSIKQELIWSAAGCAMNVRVDLLKFRNSGELLLIFDGKYFVSHNIISQKREFLKVEGFEEGKKHLLQGYPFVGSFLSLKSACGWYPDTD
ncbi:hypothetical protein FRX31_030077 [Thalictrum thalictroides]|uniref:F-box associated beta-propeller type 3 domain-containing protein n=1 Tax=Thalictrum thalictroides TaxID=46969 RepID=A0A7J6V5H6_THATH|nr:hypothetical protein FRX31_030077 [Thalictrum thalictroides]